MSTVKKRFRGSWDENALSLAGVQCASGLADREKSQASNGSILYKK